jgi:hypothetical protein
MVMPGSEIKFDGYRFQVVKDRREMRLYSRNGIDWTARLRMPSGRWPVDWRYWTVNLCCRITMAHRISTGCGPQKSARLVFFAFDLLHRDGKDLRALPLIERRRRLVRLVGRAKIPCLHLVEVFKDGLSIPRTPRMPSARTIATGFEMPRETSSSPEGDSSSFLSTPKVPAPTPNMREHSCAHSRKLSPRS